MKLVKRTSQIVFVLLLLLFVSLAATYWIRTSPDVAYRLASVGSWQCDEVMLDLSNGEEQLYPGDIDTVPDDLCMHEVHQFSDTSGWEALGLTQENQHRYELAFLEILDNGSLGAGQLESLVDRLDSGRQTVVMAYVHGWRHNAAWQNGNVSSFRTMLAYVRSFLNTRCVQSENGDYCNADLVGVYIGWRGAQFEEYQFLPTMVRDAIAAPTLFDRKAQSEELSLGQASPLNLIIDELNQALQRDAGSVSADKLMFVGHSLGGNMLISALGPQIAEAARVREPSFTDVMALDASDLVVLINPAAEAMKWHSIQRAEREAAGFTSETQNPMYFLSGDDHEDAAKAWRTQYPLSQRPLFISLTAVREWNDVEDTDGEQNYDFATDWPFEIYARLTYGHSASREQITAMGHYRPQYISQPDISRETASRILLDDELALGASHDAILNSGLCPETGMASRDCETSYLLAHIPEKAWCEPNVGGLVQVREDAALKNGFGNSVNWDWDDLDGGGDVNVTTLQFRHQLALASDNDWHGSVAPPNSPFWNVRAPDNLLVRHDTIYSYPLWCALTQLWLDPITDTTQPELE